MSPRDRAPRTRQVRRGREPGFVFEAAGLIASAILSLGCAVELEEAEPEPAEVVETEPKIELNEPPDKGGISCGPVLNADLELLAWYCAGKRLIEPGDDFGEDFGGGSPGGGNPIPVPDPLEPLHEISSR